MVETPFGMKSCFHAVSSNNCKIMFTRYLASFWNSTGSPKQGDQFWPAAQTFPLSDENSGRFVTDKLQKIWESEKHHCKMKAQTLEKRVWYAFCQRCYHHFDGECIDYNFSPSLSTVSRVSRFQANVIWGREYFSALRLRVSYVSQWFDRWSWYAPARLQMWNTGGQNGKRPEGTGVPQGRHDP